MVMSPNNYVNVNVNVNVNLYSA